MWSKFRTTYASCINKQLLLMYGVVLPVVGCGEEDVVEPESGVHQGNLDPILTWVE